MPKLLTPKTAVLWSAVLVFAFSCSSDRSFLKQRYTDFKHPKSHRYTHQAVKQPSNKSCLISDENGQEPHVVVTSAEEISPDSLSVAPHKSHDTVIHSSDRIVLAKRDNSSLSGHLYKSSNEDDKNAKATRSFGVFGFLFLCIGLAALPIGIIELSVFFAFLGFIFLVVYAFRFSKTKSRMKEADNSKQGNKAPKPQQKQRKTTIRTRAYYPFVASLIIFWLGTILCATSISSSTLALFTVGAVAILCAAILSTIAAVISKEPTKESENPNVRLEPNKDFLLVRTVALWLASIVLLYLYALVGLIFD